MKWKYVTWMMPIVCLWAGSYALGQPDARDAWWHFPAFITCWMLGMAGMVITAYTISHNK